MSAVRDAWVRAAAIAGALLPCYFLSVALATKSALFDWRLGFATLTLKVGPALALAVAFAGLLGLALALSVPPRRGWRLALASLSLAGLALLVVAGPVLAARRAPPLHDISTDLTDPPHFSPSVAAERAMAGANSLDFEHERVPDDPAYAAAAGRLSADVQHIAFPDIQPIAVGAPKARALAAARGAAQVLGWSVDRVDDTAGTIEARYQSFWFGFIDDIIIRVTPAGPGAIVDVRSSARAGDIDLGANAEHIRAFAKQIAEELAKG